MRSLLYIIGVFVIQGSLFAQCDSKKLADACVKTFPKEFIFSKTRFIEINSSADQKNANYLVILSKGTTYVVTVYEPDKNKNQGKLVVSLYDNKDRLIMSSYSLATKKYYNKITFTCNATGTYYLAYLFDGDGFKGCGASAFGFKQKVTAQR